MECKINIYIYLITKGLDNLLQYHTYIHTYIHTVKMEQ